jgi:hypothetical protein
MDDQHPSVLPEIRAAGKRFTGEGMSSSVERQRKPARTKRSTSATSNLR